jgi:hypothetical protein
VPAGAATVATPRRRRAPAKLRGKGVAARTPRSSARGRRPVACRKPTVDSATDEEDARPKKRAYRSAVLEVASDDEVPQVPKKRTYTRRSAAKKEVAGASVPVVAATITPPAAPEEQFPASLLYFNPPVRFQLTAIPVCTSPVPEVEQHLAPLLRLVPAYEIISKSLDEFGQKKDTVELLELILREASWTASQAMDCFMAAANLHPEDEGMFLGIAAAIDLDRSSVDGILSVISA